MVFQVIEVWYFVFWITFPAWIGWGGPIPMYQAKYYVKLPSEQMCVDTLIWLKQSEIDTGDLHLSNCNRFIKDALGETSIH